MKKIIILLSLIMITGKSLACDVCGCSLGGNYFGILPMFNKNFVGLRWSQAKFHSYIHEGSYLPAQYSDDTYSKVELWGRYYINKKFQVFAFVPYVDNDMNGSDQVVSAHGLGDITLMSNYLLFNTGEDSTKLLKHTLMAGGGVKLPTGKYNDEDKGKIINRNFQMGTGSVDFIVAAVYTVRYKKVGANVEAGYKINTRNSNNYLFGNQFHISSQLFYWKNLKSLTLLPNAGLYYETAARHKDGDIIQANTGGSSLLASAGLETYYKYFTIGFNYKHPLTQQYNSDETADITGKDRWTVSLTYNF
jgi:hypothetical protein